MLRPTLALATTLILTLTAPALAQVADHLKCYQAKDPLNLAGVVDLNSPQFGFDPGCKVSRRSFFCVPATKTVVSAEDKNKHIPITPLPVSGPNAGDRICYELKCPATVLPPDQVVTDQFGTRLFQNFKVQFLCAPAVKGAAYCGDGVRNGSEQCDGIDIPAGCSGCQADCRCRFVDNGDGTVTDHQTGLQWEKKDNTCPGLHCATDLYTWNSSGSPYPPDGTAFTSFLDTLNGGATGVGNCNSSDATTITGGFAGHCDWRLPTIVELKGIVDTSVPGCGVSPFTATCIDPIFGLGPFFGHGTWSSTSYFGVAAWLVNWANGSVTNPNSNGPQLVFGVRGGS